MVFTSGKYQNPKLKMKMKIDQKKEKRKSKNAQRSHSLVPGNEVTVKGAGPIPMQRVGEVGLLPVQRFAAFLQHLLSRVQQYQPIRLH